MSNNKIKRNYKQNDKFHSSQDLSVGLHNAVNLNMSGIVFKGQLDSRNMPSAKPSLCNKT